MNPTNNEETVSAGVQAIRESLERQVTFAQIHGFYMKAPHYWKNCLVLKFDFGRFSQESGPTRTKFHQKVKEKTSFLFTVLDRFETSARKSGGLDMEGRLVELGIYQTYYWSKPHWGIPDQFPEVQAYVLQNLPEWVEVKKRHT